MTADQVKMMRDYANKDDGTGTTKAYSMTAVFNNEISFSNKDHYVIYDDANELIHCLEANTSTIDEASVAPYKINTGFYGNIQYMEGLYTMKNFGTAVKDLFLDKGLITQDQYDQIMNWSQTIRNSMPDKKPMYYKETAAPIPRSPSRVTRKDGVFQPEAIHHYSERIEVEKWMNEYLAQKADEAEKDFLYRKDATIYITDTSDKAKLKEFFMSMKDAAEAQFEDIQNFSVYTNNGLFASTKRDMPSAAITKSLEDNPKFETHLEMVLDGLKENNRVSANTSVRVSVKTARCLTVATLSINPEAEEESFFDVSKKIDNWIGSLSSLGFTVAGHTISGDTNVAKNFDYDGMKAVVDEHEPLTVKVSGNGVSEVYSSGGDNFDEIKEMIELLVAEVDEPGEKVAINITFERGSFMLVYTLNVTYNAPDQCTVDGVAYHTVADALANAPAGSTIVLSRDVEITEPLVSTRDMTIDFGEYRIVNNKTDENAKWALRANAGTLTLNGTTGGVTGATGGSAGTAVAAYGNAQIIINGGHYVSTHDNSTPPAGNATIELNEASSITINGGDFVAETDYRGWYYVLNQQNQATGTFQVKGGTFHRYNPAVGDDNLKGNFVADGYISEELTDGVFTVREMTEAEKEAARERAAEIAAEAKLDAYFSSISAEGVTVEEVSDNVYNISLNQQSFDAIELVETMAGMDDLQELTVSDGTNSISLTSFTAQDIADFKARVDAMIPSDGNTVELTFSLDF